MSPRAYDRTLRRAAAEEARRRIVEAAAALHAKHGGSGTSHAMIARKAGVSIPTVYKYFPTRDHLIPACTGLVASRAPLHLDGHLLDGLKRVPDRVRTLTRSLFRLHEYYSPWLRWSASAAPSTPALRAFLEQAARARRELTRQALTAPGGRPPSETLLLLAHVLLEYSSWRTLTSTGNTSDQAAAIVADAILRLWSSPRS